MENILTDRRAVSGENREVGSRTIRHCGDFAQYLLGLVSRIAAMFPDDVSITRPGGRWRSRLRLSSGLTVSVLIARPIQRKRIISWRIDPARLECEFVTLLARLDKEHRSFLDFHVFPTLELRDRFHMSLADPWLNCGQPLSDLFAFCEVVSRAGNRGDLARLDNAE
jgi:hypothetical protein